MKRSNGEPPETTERTQPARECEIFSAGRPTRAAASAGGRSISCGSWIGLITCSSRVETRRSQKEVSRERRRSKNDRRGQRENHFFEPRADRMLSTTETLLVDS